MKIEKKIVGQLEKCYAIAPLHYKGKDHILVAAEKQDPCLLFDLEGKQEEVVWEGPGGTMSMVQVPGTDGQFLATHKFYSPNDSKEAKIVVVTPDGQGKWKVETLAELPFVHRFDIIRGKETRYIIACTIKSDHRCKDDWTSPGKVYAAELPEDLSGYNQEHQLEFRVIKDDLTKNHGYCRIEGEKTDVALVSSQEGVFQFIPPEKKDGEWKVIQLIQDPTSDAVMVDFDGDGMEELLTISPFHGDSIFIYKRQGGIFRKVYTYPRPAEFSHAIFAGAICGIQAAVIGHRKGERNLILFFYDQNKKEYASQILDTQAGAANVYKYHVEGKEPILATNREINEIAIYKLS